MRSTSHPGSSRICIEGIIAGNTSGCFGYTTRDGETYYAQLKCHDPSGDNHYVTLTRKTVRLSSYQDETIWAKVEAWAGIEELAPESIAVAIYGQQGSSMIRATSTS
ncbi:MAG: hypothetical protein GX882_08925 [Methanomicrobiales archaeon]|nr:hypothetical protein [Methanomicrobiales archaeon]